MPKTQSFCIYCGGAGLTKEHLYADWLRNYIPRRGDMHGIQSMIIAPDTTSRSVTMRTGDTHTRKIRRVCGGGKEHCNTGWMSELQQDVKPFLLPMLKDEPVALSRSAQKTVSTWAAMTAMTGEFLDSNDEFVAVPQWQRDYLRENQRVPPGWRIWIGRYRWAEGVERWTHHVMSLAEEGYQGPAGDTSYPPNTQTTTICVGNHLVIHVMSSCVAKDIIRRWWFPKHIAPALRQICPAAAATVRWPPARVLEPPEVFYVANEFFRRCGILLRKQTAS
jgi:hypothetical protein